MVAYVLLIISVVETVGDLRSLQHCGSILEVLGKVGLSIVLVMGLVDKVMD